MADQKGILFAGDMYVAFEETPGVFGAFEQLECDKLEISTPSELKENISKGRSTYGQAVASVPIAKPAEFSVTFSEVTARLFAAMLSGTSSVVNVAAGTMADLPITAVHDMWVQLPEENIAAAGFSVKNVAGTTTYAEGTDYIVNRRLGLLKALSTGAIAAGPVHVSGASNAITGTQIAGASKYKSVFKFKLDGLNLVDQTDKLVWADRASVSADEAYDFLQSDMARPTLKGRLEIPAIGQSPFYIR